MPVNPDFTGTLGPGTLTIGETGSVLDVSCLVNSAKITPNITDGDSKTMLCGTVKRAGDVIDWTLNGNFDVDAGTESGLFALSWQHIGETVAFVYTPNTELGTIVTGTLKLAPLELGADNYGDYLASDFEWGLVDFDPATDVVYGVPAP